MHPVDDPSLNKGFRHSPVLFLLPLFSLERERDSVVVLKKKKKFVKTNKETVI